MAGGLQDLHRRVYEITGWGNDEDEGRYLAKCNLSNGGNVVTLSHYVYTTDYLLDKLPRFISKNYFLTISPSEKHWYAVYSQYALGREVKFNTQDDTALRCLLNITIALYEAGEL